MSSKSSAQSRFSWRGDHGYYPVEDECYDDAYFNKYVGYALTPAGQAITRERVALVDRWSKGPVIDVGIGCGDFLRNLSRECYGYDVCLPGIEWLKVHQKWVDLATLGRAKVLTFWDSFEHIRNPFPLPSLATEAVFLTIPIFRDARHARRSKHFRPTEHYWYFTFDGLLKRFKNFELVEWNKMEEKYGREDVQTFAFRRRK